MKTAFAIAFAASLTWIEPGNDVSWAGEMLPLLGIVLLASPFANVVAHAGSLAGIPVGVLYVFGVWLGLIAATARLAGRLRADDGEG